MMWNMIQEGQRSIPRNKECDSQDTHCLVENGVVYSLDRRVGNVR